MDVAGKRILVVGLGVSGMAAARAVKALGADVRVSEGGSSPDLAERAAALRQLGVEVELGGHRLAEQDADLAIVSPGIPPSAPVIGTLERRAIEWFGEVELAYRLASCDLLAVTGTNGKTTTTALLASILGEGGIPSEAAGNIGFPAIEAISAVGPGGAIALEVSSFQLATTVEFRPHVAVILNIAEDHTDWHGSTEAYAEAKGRIVANQTAGDFVVVNVDDDRAVGMAARAAARTAGFSGSRRVDGGVGVDGEWLMWEGERLLALEDIPLPGAAGIADAAAAAAAALCYGVEIRAVVRGIKSFRPLAHRLEVVAEAGGITFIDDSKATNPHATRAAVRGLHDVVLVAGGRSKGIDLSVLSETVPPVIAVVAIGEARADIESVFGDLVVVERAGSMEDAVRLAAKHAVPGGSVLLSPACASLDMYESYAQRGERFAEAVRELLGHRGTDDGD